MLLDIENLTKTFPGVNNTSPVEVLKGLELKVEEGETTAIIGQSGSGKSTLLSLLAGLDQPTSGTLKLKERHLDSMSEEELTKFRAENIGIIFQQFHLMTHLNALENVSLPLEMNHQQDALELAEKALKQVGLARVWIIFPTNSVEGSASGWPLPGRSSFAQRFFLRMSRRGTWIMTLENRWQTSCSIWLEEQE